jgi:hypothetical protein
VFLVSIPIAYATTPATAHLFWLAYPLIAWLIRRWGVPRPAGSGDSARPR